jgi:hypothetical protein
MQDVVNRLRDTKRESDKALFQDGREWGESWAKDQAEACELQRLEESRSCWKDELSEGVSSAYSVAERLYFLIRPDDDRERDSAASFWDDVVKAPEHKVEQSCWVRGFAEGAWDVWETVKGQL